MGLLAQREAREQEAQLPPRKAGEHARDVEELSDATALTQRWACIRAMARCSDTQ